MAEGITLIENGRSRAVIVVPPELGQPAMQAVEDLVETLATMTGVALPVTTDDSDLPPGAQVHIGLTRFVERNRLQPADVPVNGYRIVTLNDKLTITGTHPIGISHGVYSLLIEELGVMWGMPNDIFTDIPQRKTVIINEMDRTERPSFGFRVPSGAEQNWARRNRLDWPNSVLPYYGHGHNLFRILPPSLYKGHPEYYAYYDGRRHVPEDDSHTHVQPCLTNPDVIRITVKTVRRHFDENPNVSTYSLCPNDSDNFCRCPNCAALDDTMEEYRGRRMNSNSYFHYVKAVAEEILKSHPDRYLGTYAYWTTELLPHGIDHLPANVVVYLTQDSSQYFDPEYEARDMQILKDWSEVADHLAVYDYYGLSWHTPRYYPGIVKRVLPHLPSVNVKGFYCETYPHWAHTAPQQYIASRLWWDTTIDADAAMDEWFERMFREAAPQMKAFYDTLEESWMNRWKKGRWFLGLTNVYVHMISWTKEYREKAWKLINDAYKAARNHLIRQRVEYILNGHRFAYLLSHCWDALEKTGEDHQALEEDIRHVLSFLRQGMEANDRHIVPDTTYGPAYYRGKRVSDTYDRCKGVIAMKLNGVLKDDTTLREKLMGEDVLFAEMMDIAVKPDWIKWIDDTKKEIPEA